MGARDITFDCHVFPVCVPQETGKQVCKGEQEGGVT